MSLSLEDWHSAAITANGDLYCWDDNEYGQIGSGTENTSERIESNPSKNIKFGKLYRGKWSKPEYGSGLVRRG